MTMKNPVFIVCLIKFSFQCQNNIENETAPLNGGRLSETLNKWGAPFRGPSMNGGHPLRDTQKMGGTLSGTLNKWGAPCQGPSINGGTLSRTLHKKYLIHYAYISYTL